jgi:hypothetical protein
MVIKAGAVDRDVDGHGFDVGTKQVPALECIMGKAAGRIWSE